ncbi:hypothetical protein EO98_14530 [Methanosarcina sp. 2.H.T.1A.6]|uniref:hypothetical protein n=1 Tax=unclassified Methanosarcina TaxID=2644672 RepID=UPI0006211918|nr:MULTISPECIES: hypothetical protein [unclassified Methanosarcina]KKG18394.1 hypothetical protein EO94_17395 [Methanosarcina sp. 2.H.T.1A.3]KKG23761.1 hypothetical protein EO98_14530 [Methanosarcina sp. 2.H.T.1A.6]KKG24739.1 hypothetical protein EO96_16900 [Methanosarcina sp. 2.H.T.1A.8]KKG27501.1 hypothetical protein EO97_10995 [Methanosarcina sp. 2.H.T.1A.15]
MFIILSGIPASGFADMQIASEAEGVSDESFDAYQAAAVWQAGLSKEILEPFPEETLHRPAAVD